jgi:hypothetical protein
MPSQSRDVSLPVSANQAYALVRSAGSEIPGFKLVRENPQAYSIDFARGFGWTNPVDVTANVFATADGQAQIRVTASILALADPFGFLPSVLGLFEQRIQQHVHSMTTGAPLPPPKKDGRAMTVNLVIIAVCLGFILAIGVLVLVVALT